MADGALVGLGEGGVWEGVGEGAGVAVAVRDGVVGVAVGGRPVRDVVAPGVGLLSDGDGLVAVGARPGGVADRPLGPAAVLPAVGGVVGGRDEGRRTAGNPSRLRSPTTSVNCQGMLLATLGDGVTAAVPETATASARVDTCPLTAPDRTAPLLGVTVATKVGRCTKVCR